MAENRRQLEQAITDGFDRDLHPDPMAGQNIGTRSLGTNASPAEACMPPIARNSPRSGSRRFR